MQLNGSCLAHQRTIRVNGMECLGLTEACFCGLARQVCEDDIAEALQDVSLFRRILEGY